MTDPLLGARHGLAVLLPVSAGLCQVSFSFS